MTPLALAVPRPAGQFLGHHRLLGKFTLTRLGPEYGAAGERALPEGLEADDLELAWAGKWAALTNLTAEDVFGRTDRIPAEEPLLTWSAVVPDLGRVVAVESTEDACFLVGGEAVPSVEIPGGWRWDCRPTPSLWLTILPAETTLDAWEVAQLSIRQADLEAMVRDELQTENYREVSNLAEHLVARARARRNLWEGQEQRWGRYIDRVGPC